MNQETEHPDDRPNTPTPPPALSQADQLRALADKTPIKKTNTAISKVIELRDVLTEERCRGRTSDGLAELLAEAGVNITPGTLRNYLADIDRAISALESDGNAAPSDAAIHRRLNEIVKAARASTTFEATDVAPRHATQTPKATVVRNAQSTPQEPSTCSTSVMGSQHTGKFEIPADGEGT